MPGHDTYRSRRDVMEQLEQSLYDSVLYPHAGGRVQFFTECIGQGVGIAGGPKLYADTNMVLPHILPEQNSFLIRSIKLSLKPRKKISPDLERLFWGGAAAELRIGARSYSHLAPASELSEILEDSLRVTFGADQSLKVFKGPMQINGLELGERALLLTDQWPFMLELSDIPPAKIDARIFCHLGGTYFRPIQ